MAPHFPIEYLVDVIGDGAREGHVESGAAPAIRGGPPIEFGGRNDWWSPEQLLLAATGLCLMATFRALAEREKLVIERYRSRVKGTLNHTGRGLAFTAIRLEVDLSVPPIQAALAVKVFDRAKRHCIVSNSLHAPVEVDIEVNAGDVAGDDRRPAHA